MGIDCTCTLGTRSAGWDDIYDSSDMPDGTLDAVKSMPVYDDLVDPFCPIHSGPKPPSEPQQEER